MSRIIRITLGIGAGILLASVAAEVAAQAWVYGVARRGKLFRPDDVLGWRPLANLHRVRKNADGDFWTIDTDSEGWRTPRTVGEGRRRVVILGDSYAFGEGVEVAERFDELVARRHPQWRFINRGVMGFGTDQELLTLPPDLVAGDVVLLLTYQNDMIDILRRSFAGRHKPYYELDTGTRRLVLRRANIGWPERLRDRSYLAALVLARRERDVLDYQATEWRAGLAIYDSLVRREAASLRRRKVHLVVVHHGDALLSRLARHAAPYAFLGSIPGVVAASADDALKACKGRVFLADGHWGSEGHRCVAGLVDSLLRAVNADSAKIR